MKLLIIAGPYEADRIRRAAVAAGFEALALEPGDSLSGVVLQSHPDVILLAPRALNSDAHAAIAKVRGQPAGGVPLFLIGDAGDERDLAALADGFFVRPLSPSDLVQEVAERVGRPTAAVPAEDEESFESETSGGKRPPSLRPLVSQGIAEPVGMVAAPFPEMFGALTARIDAALDAEFEEAVRTVGGFRRPGASEPLAALDDEAQAAVAEFAEASSHKTVEAPEQLVADMLARQAPPIEMPPAPSPVAPAAASDTSVVVPEVGGAGAFGDEDFAGLLARIYRRALTGRLIVRSQDVEKTVSFDAGHAVVATSNLPADRMADMLFREGKVNADQYARGGQLVGATGRRMGAVLVDLGFIKMSELFPSVRRHYEEIIYSLFAWTEGSWRMTDEVPSDAEKIRLSRHPAALLLEGLRRKGDSARLRARSGGPRAVLRVAEKRGPDLIAEAALGVGERKVVMFLDGSRTLDEARAAAGVHDDDVYAMACGLLALGALLPSPGAAARPPRASAASPKMPAQPGLDRESDIDRERVMARYALVQEADYFQLMGVRPDASPREIRNAYEMLRREFSPDRFDAVVCAELGPEIAAIQEVIDEGMRILGDDHLRVQYRAHLTTG